ncbi:hypothetical protein OC861_003516 [Tilletia horrida]|nr:hypothetical protein OC861_003516 [Tilletia horrida]
MSSFHLVEARSSSSAAAIAEQLTFESFVCKMLDDEGNPRKLYAVKKDGHTIECYVEATEGEAFQVRVEGGPPEWSGHQIRLEVGDIPVKTVICGRGSPAYTARDVRVDAEKVRPLLFAASSITDDEVNSIRDLHHIARLGSVRLQLFRLMDVRLNTTPSSSHGSNCAKQLVPRKAIYEKAKKVGSVGFAAGPERPRRKGPVRYSGTPDPRHTTIQFVFHCMTRVGLQVRNLIPLEQAQHEALGEPSTSTPRTRKRMRDREAQEDEERAHAERDREAQQREAQERETREREARDRQQAEIDEEKADLQRRLRMLQEREADLQRQEQSSSQVKVERAAFDFSQGGTSQQPILIE